jgi:hypothetical protein
LPVALAVGVWAWRTHAVHHDVLVLPASASFWLCLVNLVSLGFGFTSYSGWTGSFCAVLTLAPVLLMTISRPRSARAGRSCWALAAAVASLYAALSAITVGRAAHGLWITKSSRYAECAILLIPLAAFAWRLGLRSRPRFRRAVLLGLWGFSFYGLRPYWNDQFYERHRQDMLTGLDCLGDYYLRGGPPYCVTLYPNPMPAQLELAREEGLAFLKDLK